MNVPDVIITNRDLESNWDATLTCVIIEDYLHSQWKAVIVRKLLQNSLLTAPRRNEYSR